MAREVSDDKSQWHAGRSTQTWEKERKRIAPVSVGWQEEFLAGF